MALPLPAPEGLQVYDLTRLNHEQLELGRLADQFKVMQSFRAIVAMVANHAQQAEDAFFDQLLEKTIEEADGATLEMFGRVVGQPVGALTEEEFRTFIRARIRLNTSSGTITEILETFSLVVLPATQLYLTEHFPSSFTLDLRGTAYTEERAQLLVTILREAHAAGVHAALIWSVVADEGTFTLDGPAGLGLGDSADPAAGGQLAGVLL